MEHNKLHKNYLLGLDVMTKLQNDNLPEIGKPYSGIFTRIGEWDASFVEKDKCQTDGKRNFTFFSGQIINGTLRLEDLHVRLNFKELYYGPDYDIDAFVIELMLEVRKALNEASRLIEELNRA